MTEKKKMKQRIRARMQKTGESYTTARRVVAAEEDEGAITTLCVFHKEQTPSLRIWPNGRFQCYGCGRSGHAHDHPEVEQIYNQGFAPFDLSDYYELMSRAPVPEDDPIVKQAEAELRRRGWVQAQLDEAIEFGLGDAKVELAIHGKWKRPQDSEWVHREDAVWEELDAPRRKREALPKGSIEATAAYRTIVTERVMVRKDGESWVPAVPREKGIFERAEKVYLPDKTVIKDDREKEHPDTRALRNVCRIVDLSMDAARCLADGPPPKLSKKQREWAEKIAESAEWGTQKPVPEPSEDPHGYLLYVLNDLRALVKDAKPSDLALTSRFDCIEHVVAELFAPSGDALRARAKTIPFPPVPGPGIHPAYAQKGVETGQKVSVTMGPRLPNGEMLSEEMLAVLAEKMGGTVEDGRIVATLSVEDSRTQEALKGEIGISASTKRTDEVRRGDTLVRGKERLLVVGETKGGVLVVPLQAHMSLWRSKAIELSLHGIESALKGGKLKIEELPEELRDSDLSDLQPIALREAVSGLLDNLHRGDWNVAKDYWEEACLLSGRFEMEPHPWLKKLFDGTDIEWPGRPREKSRSGRTVRAEYLWVWVGGTKEQPLGAYHAFSRVPEGEASVSVCGDVTTETMETKTPGAPKCSECEAIMDRIRGEEGVTIKAGGDGEWGPTTVTGGKDPFPPVPRPGVHTVPEPELHWIWSPDKTGESARGYYHAYTEGESPYPRSVFSHITRIGTASLCGEYHTVTMETKTPGAPKCPKCEEVLRKRGMSVDEIRNRMIRLAHERPDLKPLDIKTAMRKNDLTYEECVEQFGREAANAIFGLG